VYFNTIKRKSKEEVSKEEEAETVSKEQGAIEEDTACLGLYGFANMRV
jgi:uncharacterized protein YpmB